MLTFAPGMQLLALVGLAAAVAPVVIHLFNRRRFREVEWAAMEFLLEAASRSRSLLHLRDLLLLLLRTAAVACFALAVARPFFSSRPGAAAGAGPIHAILVVDNSMSMGRVRLDGRTLLDEARDRAKAFVAQVPVGSRISVLPLCGPAGTFSFDPHRTQADAVDALDAIRVVDRGGTAAQAVDLAAQSARLAPDLPDVRTIFIGDQQATTWPTGMTTTARAEAGDVQVVALAAESAGNSWVESVSVEDGVADVDLPARIVAVLRHEGNEPRTGILVRLVVDGDDVASETVDLEPGQTREVTFECPLDAAPEPGRPAFVAATVVMAADDLPADDSRAVSIPVLASLPVVFVDERGAGGEDPARGRSGETRSLRTLLAPVLERGREERQLVQVRHLTIDQLDEDALDDARLVVIAGVRAPGGSVPLLREFVDRGGRVVVAAGGDFDPEAWSQEAWLDGTGILPAPLGAAEGTLPDEPGTLQPVLLDWRSMADDALFRLPDVADEELADLYAEPLFFRAVATAADATEARVRAAFTDGRPFLVSRPVGAGEVAWISSGLSGDWNTLPKTNAMLLVDRLVRGMIAATLPAATFETADQLVMPVAATDRRATIRVTRPDETVEPLDVEALGGDAVGVTIRDATRHGVYTVSAAAADGLPLWTRPLAVNPPLPESRPERLDAAGFAARFGSDGGWRWVAPGETIGVDGARVSGQGAWWWLLAASLACLVAEQAVLAWQHRSVAAPGLAEAAA